MRDAARMVERHLAFWERGPADRPLMACWIGSRFPGETYTATRQIPAGRVTADDIDVPAFLADYDRLYRMHDAVGDDAFWTAAPYYGIPWMEAILGCPVHHSGTSFWVDPVAIDWDHPEYLPLSEGEAWLEKLVEFTRALVELADGRYPVATTLMRGPSDLVAAARGHVEMIYDLYDDPARIAALVELVTAQWIRVARAQLAEIPSHAGGYACHFYRLWAPEPVVCTQEDASASFSPDLFRRFLLPANAAIAQAFPYSVFHIHSPTLWPLEQLLELPGLACVEVNYDDNGPRLPDLLPALRLVQERKPLVIRGVFTDEEFAFIKRELSPCGLMLNAVATSVAEAREMVAAVRDASG